ncbi:hypothetical protein CSPAE12_03749 [Colletotrichum incanum]|nr:hypothetical protein CSPAE12_03749 [Colletotrichum incanum]
MLSLKRRSTSFRISSRTSYDGTPRGNNS